MEQNYYLVEAMCGHVRRGRYIPIIFPVIAESASEAAKLTRSFPRVKHHAKHAIINVTKTDEEGFYNQKAINSGDPYLKTTAAKKDEGYDAVEISERTVFMSNRNPKDKEEMIKSSKKAKARREKMRMIREVLEGLEELEEEWN